MDRKKALIMRIIISINLIIVFFGIICFIIVYFCPDLLEYLKEGNITQMRVLLQTQDTHATGAIIALLQMAQVFSIVIPSMPLHVVSGLVIGPLKGVLYCTAGFVASNTLIYAIAKKMGRFVSAEIDENSKWSKFAFLANSKHPGLMTLIAYIFPFIPNGIIPYIAAKANIRLINYAYISLVGGLPTIIIYNCIGYLLIQKNYVLSIILILLMLVASLLMFFFRDKLMNFTHKIAKK